MTCVYRYIIPVTRTIKNRLVKSMHIRIRLRNVCLKDHVAGFHGGNSKGGLEGGARALPHLQISIRGTVIMLL